MSVASSGDAGGSLHGGENRGRSRFPLSRKAKVVTAVVGALLAGSAAYAGTNWAVGLAGGSSGEAQSASVSNLTITAV
ncbi:MAG: hypothetical protein ABSB52_09950, partial [Acidimicrobiales bacterium]